MKSIFTTFLMGLFLLLSPSLLAQKRGKASKKHNHHANHNHKARHYHRNKVVIIKKRRGRVIAKLPNGHLNYIHKGRNLIYHNGWFYEKKDANYVTAITPYGLRIKTLPVKHQRLIIVGKPYIFANGIYYTAVHDEYEVTEPIIGAIVDELPEEEVEEITVDGEALLEHEGYLYKKITTNEKTQYELVGKLEE